MGKTAPVTVPRAIVYDGTLAVRVSTVESSANRAIALVTAANGTIDADNRSGPADQRSATLRFRLPPQRFHPSVGALAKLGTEITRTIRAQDVTQKVSDLDSRITSARASVLRTRQLFSRATDISDIVRIETELSNRESTLESLLASKRGISDQVASATLTLTLSTAPKAAPPADRGFFVGLSAGWSAFLGTMDNLATAFGAALPFLVALAIPVVIVWIAIRRRHWFRAIRPRPRPRRTTE